MPWLHYVCLVRFNAWHVPGKVHFLYTSTGIIKLLVNNLLLPAINSVAGHGVQIPLHLDGVQIHDAHLTTTDGYVLMEADFAYNPTAAHKQGYGAFGRRLAVAAVAAAVAPGAPNSSAMRPRAHVDPAASAPASYAGRP